MHECTGELTTHECGCVTGRCDICGVAWSEEKCELHTPGYPHSNASSEYYLTDSDGMRDRIPQARRACDQFADAAVRELGLRVKNGMLVLDVGAGMGLLAPYFLHSGVYYSAIDPDPWACEFIRNTYLCDAECTSLDDYNPPLQIYGIVIMSHALEHFQDAKKSLQTAKKMLGPYGQMVIIVPDDTDLLNPDHYWFFTQDSIRFWLHEIGFQNAKTCYRKYIVREGFIYAVAS